MCLIAFAYNCHPKYSLILIANRDEFYQRPSDLLNFWQDEPQILAGRDREKSGTWLGITTTGRFSAVTNYRDGHKTTNKRLRSRGELTRNFLCTNIPAQHYLQQLASKEMEFSDFNLLLGDQSGFYYASNKSTDTQKLESGIYALSNALLDTPWPKVCYVKAQLSRLIKNKNLDIESLIEIMSDQTQASIEQLPDTGVSLEWEKILSSTFIKTSNYGTRATTVLLQEKDGTTQILEQSYGTDGKISRKAQLIQVPPIG
ncbi:NRDE family protein [Neptuniibacter marinus]|uniref:NRDE family protein n=1 Tax=Neptuniibacter marinus TaxID=1806670 RepID=UPI00083163EB|nr:NRDE family protein [Neptuniibacter marinus]